MKHINNLKIVEGQEEIPPNPMGTALNSPERYAFVDGEWWYYYPEDGTSLKSGNHVRERASTLRKRLDSYMYVNGKYIPKSHPLYRAGKFKTFESVAFASLNEYSNVQEGYVYIVSNPAWERWFKVGMALDAYDRCAGYQTSSPFRDYVVEYCKFFTDRKEAEKLVHAELRTQGVKHSSEWFNTSLNKIKTIIKELQDET